MRVTDCSRVHGYATSMIQSGGIFTRIRISAPRNNCGGVEFLTPMQTNKG